MRKLFVALLFLVSSLGAFAAPASADTYVYKDAYGTSVMQVQYTPVAGAASRYKNIRNYHPTVDWWEVSIYNCSGSRTSYWHSRYIPQNTALFFGSDPGRSDGRYGCNLVLKGQKDYGGQVFYFLNISL